MLPLILFTLLLIVSFGVMIYFLKPSRIEIAIRRHLAGIAKTAEAASGTTILKDETLGTAPWINDLVRQIPGSSALANLIIQAGLKWRTSSVILYSVIAVVIASSLAWLATSSLVLSCAIALIAGIAPYVYLYILRELRFRRCEASLPEAVDLIARALRAGHAVTSALEMLGQEIAEPLASEFRTVHEEQSLGLPLRDALLHLAQRLPRDDIRFLVTAMLVHKETGGSLAQIMDKASFVIRGRARLRGQLRTYTAQGRVTGWILCAMPFLMFGLISLVNREYEQILYTDPLGIRLIYGGLIMMAIGILAVRKIIDIKI